MSKCIACKKRDAITRGLCASDYEKIRREIRNGWLVEDVAVANGLMLPKKQKGKPVPEPTKPTDPLDALISDIKAHEKELRARINVLEVRLRQIKDLTNVV